MQCRDGFLSRVSWCVREAVDPTAVEGAEGKLEYPERVGEFEGVVGGEGGWVADWKPGCYLGRG